SIVYEKKDGEWHELFYLPDFTVDVANGKYGMFSALEVLEDTLYVACSTGMIKYNYIDSTSVFDNSITYPYYWLEITGNHPNDILFVNTGRVTAHYNGIDFLFNSTLMYQLNGIHLLGAILKGDAAVMVGDYAAGYRAVVVRGMRIN
ncbi:MAG: hypothetical protein GXO90_04730, partial [FCB group bacterium]|nr:hypothetical protein [FCB group bacterium]